MRGLEPELGLGAVLKEVFISVTREFHSHFQDLSCTIHLVWQAQPSGHLVLARLI